jgi:O-methyltransferase
MPRSQRLRLLARVRRVSRMVTCAHGDTEILGFIAAILSLPKALKGVVVEAGCYKGGGTAKFSIAAKATGRELVVFDSFEGIPPNEEVYRNLWGNTVVFNKGHYSGSIEAVKANVTLCGEIGVCHFIKGFFEDSMKDFDKPVAAAYLDVDLASSTRTCLKYLYPRLVPGGYLFSQDGHLLPVLEVFNDERFWQRELNCPKPVLHGAGRGTILWFRKSFGHGML